MSRTGRLFCGAAVLASLLASVTAWPDAAGMVDTTRAHPAWLLEIPDSVSDILVAETDAAKMHRFSHVGGEIVKIDERYMSIGLNGPGKVRAWDRRTPLGVYFITESLDTSRLHEKYGVGAYPLDYPNTWDRRNERTGYGIWLHGVDSNNPDRPPRDTDGCLSIPNEELIKIADRLQPLVTPIVVTRELRWLPPAAIAETREALRTAIDDWRESLERADIRAYLSHYADDFRHRDMSRAEWASYRLNVFERRPLERVEIEDVMLVADPDVDGLYLSRFTQTLTTGEATITTTKRLYWQRSADGEMKIIAEGSG